MLRASQGTVPSPAGHLDDVLGLGTAGLLKLRPRKPFRDDKRRWFITRYDDCLELLRDPRFSSDSRNAAVVEESVESSAAFGGSEMPLRPHLFFDPPTYVAARPFLFLDPPDHSRLRRLVSRAFTPTRVADLRPRITALVDDLVPSPPHSVDLMEAVAYPLPMRVIMELLALPAEIEPTIRRWTPALVGTLTADSLRTPQQRDESRLAQFTLGAVMAEQVEQRRQDPGADLLTALIYAEDDGDVLSPFEIVATALLLLLAGHETTANLIGNAVVHLLEHRDQLAAVTAEPSLVPSLIEETLRFAPPVQLIARTATTDARIGDVDIAAGDHVLAVIAAANRDPDRYTDPDRFDIQRPGDSHLSFGFGAHHCIGAPLARLEAELALRRLISRLESSTLVEPVEWRDDAVIRGPQSLLLAPR